jgi:RNA polymerase-binding transcription factor DksA
MDMTPEQTKRFEEKLTAEKALLEKELATVGERNPENPSDWTPTAPVMDTLRADENEVADTFEESHNNAGILNQLEIRYQNVLRALKKIEDGNYGICEISGEPIETDRLEVNPSARTSKAHMEEESSLS